MSNGGVNSPEIGFGYRPRAAYATDPAFSRGRLVPEAESATRTAFQRDRDRIVHSTAFRRLKHKTQVFIAHEGDHYRTRLTHSIEVAQIARALARALRLDEDLAEAVALVHDFGHTPFGHTGEEVLDARMKPWGGFDHNAQSLKIVTELERRYARFDGLNLSWETLEGLVKHNGPIVGTVPRAIALYNAGHDLELDRYAGLEAQAAAIADDIAYDTHDIDDGLRAGLISLEMLEEVPLCSVILRGVRHQFPDLDDVRAAHELMRRQITLMVEDVIATASSNLARLAPRSAADVQLAGEAIVTFSNSMRQAESELKSFLYSQLYRHPQVMKVRESAELIVSELFDCYMKDDTSLPEEWRQRQVGEDEAGRAHCVCDFLAGMTDTYAVREHRRLFDRTPEFS